MKKILSTLIIIFTLSCNIVYAADFEFVDVSYVGATGYTALTKDGTVFKIESPNSNKNEIIAEGIKGISTIEGLYITDKNTVDYEALHLTNVKQIVFCDYYSLYDGLYYMDLNNTLYYAWYNGEKPIALLDNVKDFSMASSGIYMRDINNNLHYHAERSSSVQYLASNIISYQGAENYYMDNSGSVFKYVPYKNTSEIVLRSANINIGIRGNLVFKNDKFILLTSQGNYDYPCSHGYLDAISLNSHIAYIGTDRCLYMIEVKNPKTYKYMASTEVFETKIKDNVKFKKLYVSSSVLPSASFTNDIHYALDDNNNLYNFVYTNPGYTLSAPVQNAIPCKTSYNGNSQYLILTENGKCLFYGRVSNYMNAKLTYEFLETALDKKNIIYKVNNEEKVLTTPIQTKNNRSMYPMRECLETLGASVQWDGINNIAIGQLPGIKIEFPIGKNEYYINGIKYTMDTTTYVDESLGRTYIPIRYAAEGLGFTVDWIEGDAENTISIHK